MEGLTGRSRACSLGFGNGMEEPRVTDLVICVRKKEVGIEFGEMISSGGDHGSG